MSDISPIPVDPRYPISKYVLDCDRNSSGNAHTPIANFYVVGKPNFSSFKDGITPIIYLAAVQIFRNPGVENSEYLLLHCAPDQSLLGVKCPDTTTPSGLAWTLTGDGNRLSVEPSVDLSLKIPCPLMWLNLKILLNQFTSALPLNKLRWVRQNHLTYLFMARSTLINWYQPQMEELPKLWTRFRSL